MVARSPQNSLKFDQFSMKSYSEAAKKSTTKKTHNQTCEYCMPYLSPPLTRYLANILSSPYKSSLSEA